MAEAEERTALLSGRRKLLNAEKKQKKEQKLEAESHVQMQEQLVRCLECSMPTNAAGCLICCRVKRSQSQHGMFEQWSRMSAGIGSW